MKFKINREFLLNALSRIQNVVEKKNTMAVLMNVMISAKEDRVELSGTDLQAYLSIKLSAEITETGSITVIARNFLEIVREIQTEEILIEVLENDRLKIKAGNSEFVIHGLDAQEFPTPPQIKEKTAILPCNYFLEMIQKTSFAMASDETRTNLAGVYLTAHDENQLRMVATDGHRLCLIDHELILSSGQLNQDLGVVIPKKGVLELKKLMAEDSDFELGFDQKYLFARRANTTLVVRLVETQYPEYEKVIPQDNDQLAVIPREKLIGALRRVSLMASDKTKSVVFKFSPSLLEVSTQSSDLGHAHEEFDMDYSGPTWRVGFNARYFLEALENLSGESVCLMIKIDFAPCIIKSETEPGFLGVIMPMRMQVEGPSES